VTLTKTLAERVAQRMRRDGFVCTSDDVLQVWAYGYLDGRESLASRILQEFDELGVGAAQ
jgi:hypothetical protein